MSIAPPTQTTVVNYTYDPLYRLTRAKYSTYSGAPLAPVLQNRSAAPAGKATKTPTPTRTATPTRTPTTPPLSVARTITYTFDAVGNRLTQNDNGTQTRYVLDLNAGLTQVLADGSNTYLYGNGRIAQYQTTMQYFGADALGSVRQMYNASGQVIANTRYDPYGNVLSTSGAKSLQGS